MKAERKSILQKLMHKPTIPFNKLWAKQGPGNAFAYHIKILEEDGFISKGLEGYSLTHEGKKLAAYLDGGSGQRTTFPVIGVIIAAIKEKQILLMKRAKEPFYGYWSLLGGKLQSPQYVLTCAAKELKEETGLEADVKLKGLFSSNTYNNNSLLVSHQLFVIKATNPKGEILDKTREGSNKWFDIQDIPKKSIIPDVPLLIDMALSERFRFVEADKFQENDKFIEMKILRDEKI